MVCYSYLNQTKPKANLAAHALYQFSIRENHLISERERETETETETETESAYVCGNQNPSWLL